MLKIRDHSVSIVMAFRNDIVPTSEDCLAETEQGIWFGTQNNGMVTVRIDLKSGSRQIFDRPFNAVGEDRTGRIWLATASELGYSRATGS